ncbi:MAG: outer membrane protein transport protein [Deltaproteobacteria bacterium]|nr:outer membrane protein transport protein [Myxococcales bacterium]MDP3217403.1 outer membrane protein transport protein [Deltaproteobacteria bacterium]
MRRRSAALLLAALAAAPATASAGGFYLTDRGVRPLGRGGAFIAGADDQHAIWYNPAGLMSAGSGLLLDASLVNFGNSYTRSALPDRSMDPVTFETTRGEGAALPIPTLVASHNFGLRNFMFAAGAYAPYAAITSYPDSPTASQRYSLVTLDGSLLVVAGLWAAWRPHPMVHVGAGVSALTGTFIARQALSACPATITCAPEDPQWDAMASINVGPIFAPTANVGVQFMPHRMIAFGASYQLPYNIDAPAKLGVRLPSASYYDGAEVSGDAARVQFRLAPIARVGVEFRPLPSTRVELAGVWEGWSVHERIDIAPDNIALTNVRGVGTYQVGALSMNRQFQDTWSVRLGGEHLTRLGRGFGLQARFGISYETSATANEYTNALTLDTDKFVGSLGASLHYGHFRFDAVFAYMFASSVVVDPRTAALYPVEPFRSNGQGPRIAVNGGTYDFSVNVVGLGARYQF